MVFIFSLVVSRFSIFCLWVDSVVGLCVNIRLCVCRWWCSCCEMNICLVMVVFRVCGNLLKLVYLFIRLLIFLCSRLLSRLG